MRCREEEPSQLDLVFTKTPESRPSIHCLTPLGRSNHVIIEIVPQEEKVLHRKEMGDRTMLKQTLQNLI